MAPPFGLVFAGSLGHGGRSLRTLNHWEKAKPGEVSPIGKSGVLPVIAASQDVSVVAIT